jgi:hypothetical protein
MRFTAAVYTDESTCFAIRLSRVSGPIIGTTRSSTYPAYAEEGLASARQCWHAPPETARSRHIAM